MTRFSISITILRAFFGYEDGTREAEEPPTTLEYSHQEPLH
jgi:hypothetical protein